MPRFGSNSRCSGPPSFARPSGELRMASQRATFHQRRMSTIAAPASAPARVHRRARQRADRVPRHLQMAPRVAAYDQSPAGKVRAYFASGRVESPGDPAKMAVAIIASADQHPAPRRIALGSDAYAAMHAARAPRRSRGAERPRLLDRRRVTGLTTPGGLSGYVRGVTCAPPRRTRECPHTARRTHAGPCARRRHACSSRH
jgi:hypothetical protein